MFGIGGMLWVSAVIFGVSFAISRGLEQVDRKQEGRVVMAIGGVVMAIAWWVHSDSVKEKAHQREVELLRQQIDRNGR